MNAQLSYLADRLEGVSAQELRLEPSSARNGLKAGSSISFTLPNAAIMRLNSFTVHAHLTATGVIGSAMSLLDRVEVSCGGSIISGSSSLWGVAHSIQQALSGQRGDLISQHGISPCVAVGPTPPATLPLYQTIHDVAGSATAPVERCQLTFSDWTHGFFTACPKYLDLSRLPQITVRLTFAQDTAVSQLTSQTSAPSFQLDDLSATFECISIANPAYDIMADAILQKQQYLPVTWRETTVIRAAHNGITRCAVSSRSLDRVLTAFRNVKLDGVSKQVPNPTFPSIGSPSAAINNTYEKYFATSEVFGPSGTDWGPAVDFYYNLGGSRMPQYRARLGYEWPVISQHALFDEEKHTAAPPVGSAQYTFKGVQAAKLCLAGSNNPSYCSGIDCKGQSLIIEANTGSGLNANQAICFLATQSTSLLMVGAGRSVSLAR